MEGGGRQCAGEIILFVVSDEHKTLPDTKHSRDASPCMCCLRRLMLGRGGCRRLEGGHDQESPSSDDDQIKQMKLPWHDPQGQKHWSGKIHTAFVLSF